MPLATLIITLYNIRGGRSNIILHFETGVGPGAKAGGQECKHNAVYLTGSWGKYLVKGERVVVRESSNRCKVIFEQPQILF